MKKITEQEAQSKAEAFWSDIKGIQSLLNQTNRQFQITNHRDPTITQYLLWRILSELKILNIKNIKI